jgi:hypothetical protein
VKVKGKVRVKVKGKVRVKGKVKGKGRRREGGNGENGAGVFTAMQRRKKKTDFLTADHSDGRRWIFTGRRVMLTIRSFRSFTEGNEGNEDQFSSHITRFVLLVAFCSIV